MINKSIIDKKDYKKILLLILVMFISMIFEILGIGLIPAYVFSISSYENIDKYIPELFYFLTTYEKEEIIVFISVLVIFFFLLKSVIQILTYKSEAVITSKLIVKNSSRLFNHYIHQPLQFHYQKNPSELIKNIAMANRQAGEQIRVAINILKEMIMIFSIICILLYFDYKITISLFILLVLIASIFYLIFKKPLNNMGSEVQKHQEEHLKILNHSFNGIREVKIFKNENFMKKLFVDENNNYLSKDYLHEFYTRLPKVFFEIVAIILIVFFVTYLMSKNNSFLDILPLLTLYSVVLIRFIPSFTVINSALNTFSYHKKAYTIISSILEEQSKKFFEKNKKNKKEFFFKGNKNSKIEMRDINFSYPSRKEHLVLENINLEIFEGDIFGIFGKSGEGKSTIIDLIMGLITPDKGSIKFNGIDINGDLDNWISMVGYVPQNIYLFDDTLKNNITFGHNEKNIDDERLEQVIKETNLDIFIKTLPEGLNTRVGNMGSSLSGGQRQRIGFARALYKKPNILILDEATNSVDKETENDILKNLNVNFNNKKIIIMISHNLRVLKLCTKAIFLKEKKIFKQLDERNIKNLNENQLNNLL